MSAPFTVYLLLDVSRSMAGAPLEAMKNGVDVLLSSLRADEVLAARSEVCILSFGSDARVSLPPTPAAEATVPELRAGGGTALGAALELLCRERDRRAAETDGEFVLPPAVVLFTDGYPTDDTDAPLAVFRKRVWGVRAACAAGGGCDTDLLEEIAPGRVVELSSADWASIASFFADASEDVRRETGGEEVA